MRRSGMDGQDQRRAGGRKFLADGRRLCFKGSGGEGAWRGGRSVEAERERERERGGPWAQHGAGRQRCGSGPSVTRASDALPRDNGGRRGRRDADDVADKWAGTRRVPVVSGWVRCKVAQ
jgi:hypothetical protein